MVFKHFGSAIKFHILKTNIFSQTRLYLVFGAAYSSWILRHKTPTNQPNQTRLSMAY
jgi:hypothetical protein